MNIELKTMAKRLVPSRLCRFRLPPAAENNVLLTFDDGPHPEATPAVLETLQRFGAKAIFFVVGDRISRAPDLLHQIIEEGHLIGNHTYSHPNDRRMRYREYYHDLLRCQQLITKYSGFFPTVHRPPWGQLTVASVLAPRRHGLATMNWSISSEDWRFDSDSRAVERADEMLQQIRSRDILLFHDERLRTVVALNRLLPALLNQGMGLAPDLKWLA